MCLRFRFPDTPRPASSTAPLTGEKGGPLENSDGPGYLVSHEAIMQGLHHPG